MKKIYSKSVCNLKYLILIVAFAVVNPFISNAQIKKNFLQRTSQYSPTKKIYNVKGDFTMLGNTNLTLQNYGVNNNNNNQNMVYVDIDGDENTWNSSSANLEFSQENGAIPTCSNIVFAGLYWTGKSSPQQVFTATKPGAIGTVTVNNNLNVGHNQNISNSTAPNYSTNFALSITSEVLTSEAYPVYSFNGNGNTYVFKFYNSGATNRVTLSINSQAEQNIPVTINGSGTEAILTTPYNITDGTLIIKIKKLIRLSGNNETTTAIQSNSFADVNVAGTYTGPINLNKTFNKRMVSLKGPNSASYTSILANANDIYYPSGSEDDIYSAYAEITDYIKTNGIGKYTVADIALLEGNPGGTGYSGGWGIIVIYENTKMKWRDITLFDGYAYVQSANKLGYNLPVSGFNSVQSGHVGIKMGMIASEGDVGFVGDYFKIQKLNTTDYTDLSHVGNTTTNFFNSSINVGGDRVPSLANNTGIDVAQLEIPNTNNSIVANNQTSTNFRYGTEGDTYSIFAIAMSIDAYIPEVEAIASIKTIDNAPAVKENLVVLPGKEMEFKVEIKNLGTEAINNGKLVIPIPFDATYVPNSAVGTIHFQPSPTINNVTFNPSLGSTGSIVWDIGNLPYTGNPNVLLATLTFKLKATTNCQILTNSSCGANIDLLGNLSGVGATTQIATNNNKIIQGYHQDGICSNEPLTEPLSITIDSAAYIAANCQGTVPIQTFTVCTLDSTIPITEVISGFPLGSLFYNEFPVTQTSVQYTINNPFPATPGKTTYYAVSPSKAGCSFEFEINVTTISTTPTTDGNVTYCKGATAQPLTATASDPSYTLYYYSSINGTPELSITPSTAVVGQKSYYVAEASSGTCVGPKVEIIVTILEPEVKPVLACYQTAVLNPNTCKWDITGTQPIKPALACYQIATFNDSTCKWDISGSIPEEPTMQCYEIATFNDLTCSWDISGTQPPKPVTSCYEDAKFDTESCEWFVIDNRPPPPSVACYQTATFNNATCVWVVTGVQPVQPTILCYQTATFNNTTCAWDVTGTQPTKPNGLACYETATFNNTTCVWDIMGTQPIKPTLECYQTATFNSKTCVWDIKGTQPVKPTLLCYQNATFNNTSCVWDVTGTQPIEPTVLCYQTTTFNNITCVWDISGTQPVKPSLACYETAIFNNTTCVWDITGTKPIEPTILCYQTATFNNTTCAWEVKGNQPVKPNLACYETAIFNTLTCVWDVVGIQPEKPLLECYQTAIFNNTTCTWDVSGTQPIKPSVLCYQNATFNTTTCAWDITGTQPEQPILACYETATFNNTSCVWDITGTQPEKPILACYETATFNATTCVWDVTGTQPIQPTLACYETAAFNNATCLWEVTGTAPVTPTVGEIIQPTCLVTTGSFIITNYQSIYTYIITPSEGVTMQGTLVTAPQGEYTVIASLGNGCNSEISATITINAQPEIGEVEGTPGLAKCNELTDLEVNLSELLPEGTAIGGEWINVDNVGELVTKDVITYFKPFGVPVGNYTFKYDVLIGSCLQSVIIDMKVDDDCAVLPCGDVQNVPGYAECNENIALEVNITALLPADTVLGGTWNNDNVGELITRDNITYFKPDGVATGTYPLIYTVLNGSCLDAVSVNMEVDDKCSTLPIGACVLVVHNAFSPNGDGTNDFFEIDNIENRECFPSVKVEVYNRWGVLVFESNDYDNQNRAFRGISEGRTTINKNEGLPTGTYFYIIQYNTAEGKSESKDGYLYLSK